MRQNGGDSSKKGDFLDELLSASNLSEEEKISFVLDALLGGYETTSLLISMAVYFLGQCPPALEQFKVWSLSLHLYWLIVKTIPTMFSVRAWDH